MTEKQERILKAALKLFAKEGYAATSTSKVAREADVSEGLIFRHFGNKEGLLQAVIENGSDRARALFADAIMTTNPKELIRKTLELPFKVDPADHEMWRLIYALKWQTNNYMQAITDPMKLALNNAFEKLGYAKPPAETEALLMILDGVATGILLHAPDDPEAILGVLKTKYDL